uniref:W protein n=1 Tax=Paraavulavirus wisconsinense TaxID=3052594 RepID=B5L5T5_9MONO|nr:W protein [Paraavulavirus wisconsinense]
MDLEFSSEEAVAALLDVSSSTITEVLSKQSIPDPSFLTSTEASGEQVPDSKVANHKASVDKTPDQGQPSATPSAPPETAENINTPSCEDGLPPNFFIPRVESYHTNLFKGGPNWTQRSGRLVTK